MEPKENNQTVHTNDQHQSGSYKSQRIITYIISLNSVILFRISYTLPMAFFKVREMFVNFKNPKIIYKRFNGVHMWLRNYSVNISEKLMLVSFIVLGIMWKFSQRPIRIYFWVKGQSSWNGHVFFSAICILPRPQGSL